MPDVVVTCPAHLWDEWIAEGQLPGDEQNDLEYFFWLGKHPPNIRPGERVYVVARGRIRGYAPLVRIHREQDRVALVRRGGAVAVTIPEHRSGFRGFRYRWWPRAEEVPFPEWRTP